MSKEFFKVTHKSTKSKARIGVIKTASGYEIKTPAFVPVATKATLKGLPPQFANEIGMQVAFVNTYHLAVHPGIKVIEKAEGARKFGKLDFALMSDSGGFQVFSLAKNNKGISEGKLRDDEKTLVVKIDDNGVLFRSTYDGEKILFTPELSIDYQIKIGADLIMAFDECTFYPATKKYTKESMQRSHDWLLRSIKTFRDFYKKEQQQFLYGIIQGGSFEDLRKESAKFVSEQDIDGVAIGGVSVGESKEDIRKEVAWCEEFLPDNKPVHLLGIGQIDDFIDMVSHGIDSFDCVEPTRFAREGKLYKLSEFNFKDLISGKFKTSDLWLNILQTKYKEDMGSIDKGCECYVCKNFTKSYLHHLFKQKELNAYFFATYHNLYSLERFFEKIREAINNDLI